MLWHWVRARENGVYMLLSSVDRRIVSLLDGYKRTLLADNLSERTIDRYARIVRGFALWLDDAATIDDISEDLVSAYLEELAENKQKARTRALTISSIRSFCRWAIRKKLRKDDPTLFIKRPRIKAKGRSRALNAAELWNLERALSSHKRGLSRSVWMHRRNRLCIYLMLYTGIRLGEACRLSWNTVDFAMETITVIGKGDKERTIPLPPILIDELMKVPHAQRRGPVIGTRQGTHLDEKSMDKIFSRWLPGLSVEGVTAHRLRHTYAKQLQDDEVLLEDIQALLGHDDPSTTQIYVGGPSIERLRKAVRTLPPVHLMRRLPQREERAG
jgi:integrase/recombinase XerC